MNIDTANLCLHALIKNEKIPKQKNGVAVQMANNLVIVVMKNFRREEMGQIVGKLRERDAQGRSIMVPGLAFLRVIKLHIYDLSLN